MIQFLVPSITHSSPSRTARVRIPPGSEPASGSDSANAGVHSPVAQRGRKRAWSSSEPNSLIGSVPSSWIIRISAVEAQALAISSTAMLSIRVPVPVPPCSVSNGSAEDVLLGQQRAQVVRIGRLLVDLGRPRRDPLLRDLADRVAEIGVLLRDRVQLGQRGHAAVDATSRAQAGIRMDERNVTRAREYPGGRKQRRARVWGARARDRFGTTAS